MKSTKPQEGAKEALNEEENIDKIRDILFGVQVRDFETRFARLEKYFDEEMSKNRAETQKQFAKIEDLIEKHNASLSEKIYNEQDSRTASIKDLSEDLKIAAGELSKEISGLRDKTAANEAEIKKSLADRSNELAEMVKETQKETLASLETKADDLDDSKADRRSLAKAFNEIAQLLNGAEGKGGSD